MQTWDTDRYQIQHDFVWRYGEGLLPLLAAQPGEHILDLGCGPGQLTRQTAAQGASFICIDADPNISAQAQRNFPVLIFCLADARDFKVTAPCDAVFSNATLHWVTDPTAAARAIFRALKPEGRFVTEFGGQGNVQTITAAVDAAMTQAGLSAGSFPWYFPTLAEYVALLDQARFEVTFAQLYDRPTPLKGEDGLANWVRMFCGGALSDQPMATQEDVLHQVQDRVRSRLYRDGQWWADYRRLRIVALRPQ